MRDVVDAYRLLAGSGAPTGIYNVSTARSISAADQVALLRELLAPIEVSHVVDPARVRANEVMDIRGANDKISTATGWRADDLVRADDARHDRILGAPTERDLRGRAGLHAKLSPPPA